MSEPRQRIAENLKELRLEHNYSQEYLGEVLGKNDYTAYQRLEHGKAELKFADAYKLARLYKIPMEHIFDPELRKEDSLLVKDHPITYKKKNLVQITVNLDGSEDFLESQIELLRGMNKVISGA
jgi:transcriptional regulator with XRE-family HTH domain